MHYPFETWTPRAKYLALIDIYNFHQMQTMIKYSRTINNNINNKKKKIFLFCNRQNTVAWLWCQIQMIRGKEKEEEEKNPKRNKRKVKTKIIAKLFEIWKQMPQKAIMQHLQRLFIGIDELSDKFNWTCTNANIYLCVCVCVFVFICFYVYFKLNIEI